MDLLGRIAVGHAPVIDHDPPDGDFRHLAGGLLGMELPVTAPVFILFGDDHGLVERHQGDVELTAEQFPRIEGRLGARDLDHARGRAGGHVRDRHVGRDDAEQGAEGNFETA
jgi:hypothetical protein